MSGASFYRVPVAVVRVPRLWPSWVAARVAFRTIYVAQSEPLTVSLLAHELVHVLQRERLGWRYPLAYVLGWARVGFRYKRIPMEVEAREFARHPFFIGWAVDLTRVYS